LSDKTALWPLHLDNEVLYIGRNLFEALRRLRDRQEHPRLWADAVYINQIDSNERTEQIAQMGTIYSSASRTLVWLGEDFDGSDGALCMDFFAKYASLQSRKPNVSASVLYNNAVENERPGCPKLNVAMLQTFAQRAWYSRRWVSQEIMNAKEGKVLLGGLEVPWPQLRDTCTDYRTLHLGVLRICQDTHREGREARSNMAQGRILRYPRLFDDLKCQDPRDRIAALLGRDLILSEAYTI